LLSDWPLDYRRRKRRGERVPLTFELNFSAFWAEEKKEKKKRYGCMIVMKGCCFDCVQGEGEGGKGKREEREGKKKRLWVMVGLVAPGVARVTSLFGRGGGRKRKRGKGKEDPPSMPPESNVVYTKSNLSARWEKGEGGGKKRKRDTKAYLNSPAAFQ